MNKNQSKQTPPKPIPKMLSILRDEADQIRRQSKGASITLLNGDLVDHLPNSWLYRFAISEEINIKEETVVKVRCDGKVASGSIASVTNNSVLIAVDLDLGAHLASIELQCDNAMLIERLIECLDRAQSGAVQFCWDSANRALGLEEPSSRDEEPDPAVLSSSPLNEAQLRAIRRSLGSAATFIWGPPGTGKTTTLARIAEAHFRAGRSVLVVSNTNTALDTALERVAERLECEPLFFRGLIIRHGSIVKESLRNSYGNKINLEQIVQRLGEVQIKQRDEHCQQKNQLISELKTLSQSLTLIDELDNYEKARLQAVNKITAMQSQEIRLKEELCELVEHGSTMRRHLEAVSKRHAIWRFFKGIKLPVLERHLSEQQLLIQCHRDALDAVRAQILSGETRLATIGNKIEQRKSQLLGSNSPKQVRERQSVINDLVAQLDRSIFAIDQTLTDLRRQIISNCQIEGATACRAYLDTLHHHPFDVVIVDEASMLIPPLVYLISGLAKSSVVIVGDFRQLPPIVASKSPDAMKLLKTDVFTLSGISKAVACGRIPSNLVALEVQYRMRTPICELVNELTYKDFPLSSGPSVDLCEWSSPLGTSQLLYVNTSKYSPWSSTRQGSYSRYNFLHAYIIRRLATAIIDRSTRADDEAASSSLGIVTPYAAQAKLIRSLLIDHHGACADGIAATVHRFQGDERSTILLDLTDALGTKLGRFMKAKTTDEDGARLLNVAISRAKQQLVVVGDFDYLRKMAPEGGQTARLIEFMEERGEELSLNESLLPSVSDWSSGQRPSSGSYLGGDQGEITYHSEEDFYPAFGRDLASAQKSIYLASPFATPIGTSRWIESLRGAIARGVSVRVKTRPAVRNRSQVDQIEEIIKRLRSLGVTVETSSEMHEKAACIDDEVVWSGSLNILSHWKTTELMTRNRGANSCKQAMNLLK